MTLQNILKTNFNNDNNNKNERFQKKVIRIEKINSSFKKYTNGETIDTIKPKTILNQDLLNP